MSACGITIPKLFSIFCAEPLSTPLEKPTDDKLVWKELTIAEAIYAIIQYE